ncbi:MAG: hypothetical protein ACLFTA_00105 [Candidatus Nanohaloarchaea archaeon]
MLRPDPVGLFDIFSATFVLFTASALPENFLHLHAGFLYFKGVGTLLRPNILPMPVFYLGGMADVLSAAIIFTGDPAFLSGYKNIIAGVLFVKGFLVFPSMLKFLS